MTHHSKSVPTKNTHNNIRKLSSVNQHLAYGNSEPSSDVTVIFGLKDKVGALANVLKFFHEHDINMKHIESRSSKKHSECYEFVVVIENKLDSTARRALDDLGKEALYVEVSSKDEGIVREVAACGASKQEPAIGYPRRIRDLDEFRNNILDCGRELSADHPGFNDPVYRERRRYFADIALKYNHGEPIPRVEYTETEIKTWQTVYDKLLDLHAKHACKEYNHIFPLMVENCGFRRDNIPQLEDVSRFLKDATGFRLRPVAGLLTSRDFLNGLAYRVFHSTQYIRHHANPDYTPEPDIVHELLGHAPLFADPDFARFSQEIGLASLGAPDEYITKLATCYWFTVEFGLCKQDGQIKAYGAGLLSSFGELEYSMSDKPEIRPFVPMLTGQQEYPITDYQPVYFLAESFADAQAKLHEYALSIPRSSVLHYNPYTESVEAIESTNQLWSVCKDLKNEVCTLSDSLEALSAKQNKEEQLKEKQNKQPLFLSKLSQQCDGFQPRGLKAEIRQKEMSLSA